MLLATHTFSSYLVSIFDQDHPEEDHAEEDVDCSCPVDITHDVLGSTESGVVGVKVKKIQGMEKRFTTLLFNVFIHSKQYVTKKIKSVEEQETADEDVSSGPEPWSHSNLVYKITVYHNSQQTNIYFNGQKQNHVTGSVTLS